MSVLVISILDAVSITNKVVMPGTRSNISNLSTQDKQLQGEMCNTVEVLSSESLCLFW